jgi:hypothetical protein
MLLLYCWWYECHLTYIDQKLHLDLHNVWIERITCVYNEVQKYEHRVMQKCEHRAVQKWAHRVTRLGEFSPLS